MDDEGLLDELQEELGSDYTHDCGCLDGMLSGDATAAMPYLLFSIAKSLEDISFLLQNDNISVIIDEAESTPIRWLGVIQGITPLGGQLLAGWPPTRRLDSTSCTSQ